MTAPSWTASGVTAAGGFGNTVLGVTGEGTTLWNAKTGDVVAQVPLPGANGRVLVGDVQQTAALAAVTDTSALVFVDGSDRPVLVDLSGGRSLTTRTGAFVVSGPDRSFALVTEQGEVPLTTPRPQMIVLGVDRGIVLWASGGGHVIMASPNGTVLNDAALVPPVVGATVTPKTGWLRASTQISTVVGWTLPDGQTVTALHDTSTGAVLGTFPGTGEGLLQPNRAEWVADGNRADLVSRTITPLPTGFVPVRYLGSSLYGAVRGEGDAFLEAGAERPVKVPASTVVPLAALPGVEVLLTLTRDELAVFPTSPKKK